MAEKITFKELARTDWSTENKDLDTLQVALLQRIAEAIEKNGRETRIIALLEERLSKLERKVTRLQNKFAASVKPH